MHPFLSFCRCVSLRDAASFARGILSHLDFGLENDELDFANFAFALYWRVFLCCEWLKDAEEPTRPVAHVFCASRCFNACRHLSSRQKASTHAIHTGSTDVVSGKERGKAKYAEPSCWTRC